jgi:hypothetical protein
LYKRKFHYAGKEKTFCGRFVENCKIIDPSKAVNISMQDICLACSQKLNDITNSEKYIPTKDIPKVINEELNIKEKIINLQEGIRSELSNLFPEEKTRKTTEGIHHTTATESRFKERIEVVKESIKSDDLKKASIDFSLAVTDFFEKTTEEGKLEKLVKESIKTDDLQKAGIDFSLTVTDFHERVIEEKKFKKLVEEVQLEIRKAAAKKSFFYYYKEKINFILKHPILYIFLLNVIIRIPPVLHAMGDDGFIVVWMAKAIQIDNFPIWIINPLSIFGLYPFSTYPIGGPLILSIIMIFFSEEISIAIFSLLFIGIAILTCYYLAKLIFRENQTLIILFVLFYTANPIFIQTSYWTSTLRGPFLSLLPLLLFYNLDLYNKFEWKKLILFCLSVLLVSLLYQLIFIYPLYLISSVLGFVIKNQDFLNRKYLPIYLIIYLVSFIIGILIFPIDPQQTSEFLISNDSIIGIIWNLLVDYLLKIGFILPLAFLGFIVQFFSTNEESNEGYDLFGVDKSIYIATFLMFGILLSLMSPISTYTSIFGIPWFTFYAVIGVKFLFQWRIKVLSYAIGFFPFVLAVIYSIYVVPLHIHLLGGLIIIFFSISIYFIRKERRKYWKPYYASIICSSLILVSLISINGLYNSDDFPFNYVHDDEIIISRYLKDINCEGKIILVYNPKVARRIQALAFKSVIFPGNGPANIYYNLIAIDEIKMHTEFSISNLIKSASPTPFQYMGENPERNILNQIINLNLTNLADVETLHSYGVNFIITENSTEPRFLTRWGEWENPILTSIVAVGILRVETNYLSLYEVPNNSS